MPIDASIPLSVQPAPQTAINPLQSIGQLMQLRDMAAQAQQRQYAAEHQRQIALQEQAVTEQKNRDLADANTLQSIQKDPDSFSKIMSGDYTPLLGRIQAKTLENVQKGVDAHIKELGTNTKQDLENYGTALGDVADSINGLKSLNDVGKINAAWAGAVQGLSESGAIKAAKIDPTKIPTSITSLDDLDQFLASVNAKNAAVNKALAQKKETGQLLGKTITTDQGIMGFNPDTGKYDIPQGQPVEKVTNAPKTVTVDGKVKQWNPDTQRYDIEVGAATEPSEKNPTEVTLALAQVKAAHPDWTDAQIYDAALRRLDQSKLASRPNINVNMTPAQTDATADMIGQGKIDPTSTRQMLRRQPGLLAEVKAKYPDFDEADIDKRYNTLKEFTNTSNSKAGGQVTALNTLIHHADLYQQAGEALKNGQFVPGNAAYNTIASMMGSAPPQNAALVARFLAGETGKVATGGVPAEGEIKGILGSLSANASPDQIREAGQKLLEIASGRAIPLMERVKDAKLEGTVHVIGPDAQRILSSRGFDPNTLQRSSATKPAQGGYQIGHKYSGLTYLGGDPKDRSNWK